jgi:hypothetical protein
MSEAKIFALGLDGSKLSWNAFEFVTNLMDRRAVDDTVRISSLQPRLAVRRAAAAPHSV